MLFRSVLSKKLATIITSVPVEFHEEDFKLKEWNKEELKTIFADLEFRTLGKRLLGEDFTPPPSPRSVVEKEMPQGIQTDLFGNIIETTPVATAPTESSEANEQDEEEVAQVVDKNIHNTPHQYILVEGESAIEDLVKALKLHKEICFDTETTGLDANQASLVGLSFSVKPGDAWYVPCPEYAAATKKMLASFQPLFADSSITWIGQNCKYDLLVLKWAGVEIAGDLFDTMLAHYVIEPEGKRSMDLLSEKFLGYEPVSIEELLGKKGKGQLTMREVEVEKVKEIGRAHV